MSANLRYKLAEDVFFDKNAEGILVMGMGNSDENIRLSDPVSKTIWDHLATGAKSLDELEQQIRASFKLTGDEPVREDLIEFLNDLAEAGLIITA